MASGWPADCRSSHNGLVFFCNSAVGIVPFQFWILRPGKVASAWNFIYNGISDQNTLIEQSLFLMIYTLMGNYMINNMMK